MANNRGTRFEWAVFHLIASSNPEKFKTNRDAKQAEEVYNSSPQAVKNGAANAVAIVQKKFGNITNVEKVTGKNKTDMILTTQRGGALNCSMKFSNSSQLSSASVPTTVGFITNVVNEYMKKGNIDKKAAENVIRLLGKLNQNLPPGVHTQNEVKRAIDSQQNLIEEFRKVMGTASKPVVSEEFQKIKEVIVKEALTGEYMFQNHPKKVAKWVLSERNLAKIDDALVQRVCDHTSVRIGMKGRDKINTSDGLVRLNEIVIRLDYHR